MGFSNIMMAAAKSIPKSTISQSIPSLTYSSCSTTNMWWLKNCWSLSLRNLFKAIVLEYFKSCNVQYSTKVGLLQTSINEGVITFLNKPLENSVKDCPSNTTNSIGTLLTSLTLDDPLSSNLDSRLAKGLDHSEGINTAKRCSLTREGVWANKLALSLIITTLGLEFNSSEGHDTSCEHVAVKLFLLRETQYIEGIFSIFKLFIVINGGDTCLTLGDIDVIINVITDMAFSFLAQRNP